MWCGHLHMCRDTAWGHLGGFLPPPPPSHHLLTQPTKGSSTRCVILDLSWPLPLDASVNGDTTRDSYLGAPKNMRLPSAKDIAENVGKAQISP